MRRKLTLGFYALLLALAGFGAACSGTDSPTGASAPADRVNAGWIADGGRDSTGTMDGGGGVTTCADSLRNADGTCRGPGAGSGN